MGQRCTCQGFLSCEGQITPTETSSTPEMIVSNKTSPGGASFSTPFSRCAQWSLLSGNKSTVQLANLGVEKTVLCRPSRVHGQILLL